MLVWLRFDGILGAEKCALLIGGRLFQPYALLRGRSHIVRGRGVREMLGRLSGRGWAR
jgi:hypothetical protein